MSQHALTTIIFYKGPLQRDRFCSAAAAASYNNKKRYQELLEGAWAALRMVAHHISAADSGVAPWIDLPNFISILNFKILTLFETLLETSSSSLSLDTVSDAAAADNVTGRGH